MRGESVLIEIKLEGRLLFRALFYSKEAAAARAGEGFFFVPIFFFVYRLISSFLFVSFQTQQQQAQQQQPREQKSIQYIRPTIDRSLRNDATTPRIVFIVIGFLSQLLDDRIEVTDDVEKRRAFLINRVPHVSHQRHEFFRHQPVV